VRFEEQPIFVYLFRKLQALLRQRLGCAQITSYQMKQPQAKQHGYTLRGIAQLRTQYPGAEVVLFHRRCGPSLSSHQQWSHR
jgi:hypothetical protein